MRALIGQTDYVLHHTELNISYKNNGPHFLLVHWRDNPLGMLGEHERNLQRTVWKIYKLMFVFNREDVTTMGIAQAVITAIDITAAVVDLTRVDALTNRTVLARSAVQSTRTSIMDTVEASSNREDGVHGRE